jgi:hypothetical protein
MVALAVGLRNKDVALRPHHRCAPSSISWQQCYVGA